MLPPAGVAAEVAPGAGVFVGAVVAPGAGVFVGADGAFVGGGKGVLVGGGSGQAAEAAGLSAR
jgi:hypothetical protein